MSIRLLCVFRLKRRKEIDQGKIFAARLWEFEGKNDGVFVFI